MNHKNSTIALFILIGIITIGSIIALNSQDIDEVCSTNNTFLYKTSGTWNCFNKQYEDTQTPIINAKQGLNALIFDENEKTYYIKHVATANLEQYFFIESQLSHGYKEGTNISCHLHIYTLVKDTGNTTLELNYTWYNIGDQNWNSNIITKTANLSATNKTNSIISFGQIEGTGKKISSTIKAKITRKTTETAIQDVYIDFFDCHYEKDSFGSNQEYIK